MPDDQNTTPPGGTPPPTPPPAGGDKQTFTREEVEAMKANWSENIGRHEEKAKKAAEKLEALKAEIATKEKEAERAKLDELERAKLELEETRQALEGERKSREHEAVNNAITIIGIREGAIDVGDVASLVDRAAMKIEDGKVVGVDEAVEKLKKAKPYLFGTPRPLSGTPPASKEPRRTDAPSVESAAEYAARMRRESDTIFGGLTVRR